jgi:NAD(P)-dependent dehydrogenase (short-subunit alcohol dehydrogenase family)
MEENLIPLNGRIVVVSGAGGGGIGTATVRLTARAGATVIAVDRVETSLAQHVVPLAEQGQSVIPLVADVQTPEGVAAVIECARRTPGDLHGLVTVAGGVPPSTWAPATKLSQSDWQALFSLNLDSMFFVSRAFAAELKGQKRPGSLVAISSISGAGASPFHIAYGAAKAAVNSVVRTMAVELAAAGIRVNAVAPGTVASPVSQATTADPERDRRAVPMGRRGRPEEIAGTVLFLLSDLAGYLTGQCITVDGGISVKWSHLDVDNTPMFVSDRSRFTGMMD